MKHITVLSLAVFAFLLLSYTHGQIPESPQQDRLEHQSVTDDLSTDFSGELEHDHRTSIMKAVIPSGRILCPQGCKYSYTLRKCQPKHPNTNGVKCK
uniref:Putative secreted protein n=1 Tax=Anopheles darlingi TaxID=43151 RepID=A0A2M4D1R3_ANODA